MFGKGVLTRAAAAFALFCCLKVYGLIFPLPPGPDGSYDFNFNVLQSYDHLWASNHHALYNIGSLNGVGVAPHWLLTAWHIAEQMDEHWWVNDDHDRYYFLEKVDLGNDLALIRVNKPLPFYSKIQKFAGGAGDILTVYGQSAAPEEAILDSGGKAVGWKFSPITNHPALRWGRGRRLTTPPSTIQWDFTANDLGLGSGGLNCAAVNTNDSGGGIFVQDSVVGVITGLQTLGFRYSRNDTITTNCDVNPPGHIYDPSTLYRCFSSYHPFTRAYGASVYGALSNIYAHISPPRRINAGGQSVQGPEGNWDDGTDCSQCLSYSDPAVEPVSIAGLSAPAPQTVYKTAAYVQGQPNSALNFVVSDLVKYDKYKVRLHFASIFPADKAGASLESITVNGSSKSFDPYTAPRSASILEFTDVSPDQNSEISISIQPQNPGRYATINGIEVLLNPLAPTAPPDLKWDAVTTIPAIGQLNDIIFGNGVFIGSGMISTDTGGTWQPLWLDASGFRFVNGFFFSLGGSSMLRSLDGKSWEPCLPFGVTDIAYGNGRFIAVNGNTVALSSDARNWVISAVNFKFSPFNTAFPLIFGNGRFIVSNRAFSFLSSEDGTNWTHLNLVLPDPSPGCVTNCATWQWMEDYHFVNGSFVTYGLAFATEPRFPDFIHERPSLLVSSDAITWMQAPEAPLTPYWSTTVGLGVAKNQLIYFPSHSASADVVNWHFFSVPKFPAETAITNAWQIPVAASYGNSNYVLVGINSDNYPFPPFPPPSIPVMRGPDLDSLQRVDHPAAKGSRQRFAASGRTLIIVNPIPGFPLPLHVSTNSGASYVRADLPADSRGLLSVQYLNNTWVAVGERGVIIHSPDAINWEKSFTGVTNDLFEVTFGGGTWVAVGAEGTVLTSGDLDTFSLANSGTSASLNSVCFGGAGFAAVGALGVILQSANGREWIAQTTQDADLFSIAYGNGTYLAVGQDGRGQVSTDGLNWSISHPTGATLRDVGYADGFFFTVESSQPSTGYLSEDGITWAQSKLPWNIISSTAADDSFFFLESNGTVDKLRLRAPDIVLSAQSTGDGLLLSFNAPFAGNYTVLSSNDLLTWQSETVLTRVNSDQLTWIPGNGGNRFFRVELN